MFLRLSGNFSQILGHFGEIRKFLEIFCPGSVTSPPYAHDQLNNASPKLSLLQDLLIEKEYAHYSKTIPSKENKLLPESFRVKDLMKEMPNIKLPLTNKNNERIIAKIFTFDRGENYFLLEGTLRIHWSPTFYHFCRNFYLQEVED